MPLTLSQLLYLCMQGNTNMIHGGATGSASDSSSAGCVFKSRPGQLFYQFLRVDAFHIISIVICVHAMKR